MLVCFNCRNQDAFVQVAEDRAGTRKERRVVIRVRSRGSGPPRLEPEKGHWTQSSLGRDMPSGLYCAECKKPVEAEKAILNFISDKPATVLDPADFKVDAALKRVRRVLSHAEIYSKEVGARTASYKPLSMQIQPSLENALRKQGIDVERLYSHQAQAVDSLLAGKNVIVATSAASGKTLCFNIPVLNAMLKDNGGRALYMYPTKALAQDQILHLLKFDDNYSAEVLGSQKGSFFRFTVGGVRLSLGKYDGSTDDFERKQMRKEPPNILLTNPDMLHLAILRHNGLWTDFLTSLKYIVLDEVHVYKGIFGSNVALILRRLRKICSALGAKPQFILCSATIGNPLEHARALTGIGDFVLVSADGSPSNRRVIVVVNPPQSTDDPDVRLEPSTIAVDILSKVLLREAKPVKTIVFGRSRLAVKNTYRVLKRRLEEEPKTVEVAALIREYTATLTPEDRERISKELSLGNLVAVIGTNALELGIDIGNISTAIAMGYPGSVASLYQGFGRAGRRGEGLGILIVQNNALEQYYAKHPEELLTKRPEDVKVNPQNQFLLTAHLACCAYENEPLNGIEPSDFKEYFGIDKAVAESLLKDSDYVYKQIRDRQPRLMWKADAPVYGSIRNPLSRGNFSIECDGEEVGVMDEGTVIRDLHPGAVWTNQDEQYVVQRLDFKTRVARVHESEVDYYTIAIPVDRVDIEKEEARQVLKSAQVAAGLIKLTRHVVGFKKIYFGGSHKNETCQIEQYMPFVEFPTTATWITIDIGARKAPTPAFLEGGLHALEHAIVAILPKYVDCDPNDVSGISDPKHPATGGRPSIFVYDNFAGGIGLSATLHQKPKDIVKDCRTLIEGCECKDDGGCPACIHSPRCGDDRPLSKSGALALAKVILSE